MNCSASTATASCLNPMGIDARVTPTAAEGVTSAGRLKEIM